MNEELVEVNMKALVKFFGGKCLFGGALIQFGEESFKKMYVQIYEAGKLTEREHILKIMKEGLWDKAGLQHHLEQGDKNEFDWSDL
jgi:hypothetical protein